MYTVPGNVYMSIVVADECLEIGATDESPDVELPHCEYLTTCSVLNFEL